MIICGTGTTLSRKQLITPPTIISVLSIIVNIWSSWRIPGKDRIKKTFDCWVWGMCWVNEWDWGTSGWVMPGADWYFRTVVNCNFFQIWKYPMLTSVRFDTLDQISISIAIAFMCYIIRAEHRYVCTVYGREAVGGGGWNCYTQARLTEAMLWIETHRDSQNQDSHKQNSNYSKTYRDSQKHDSSEFDYYLIHIEGWGRRGRWSHINILYIARKHADAFCWIHEGITCAQMCTCFDDVRVLVHPIGNEDSHKHGHSKHDHVAAGFQVDWMKIRHANSDNHR